MLQHLLRDEDSHQRTGGDIGGIMTAQGNARHRDKGGADVRRLAQIRVVVGDDGGSREGAGGVARRKGKAGIARTVAGFIGPRSLDRAFQQTNHHGRRQPRGGEILGRVA